MKFSTFQLVHRPEGSTHEQVYARELAVVEAAEELGFHGVWLAEHHFRNYGICPNIMTFAAFVAARTKRVRIGSAIVVLPLHHPIRAAEEAAFVDVLSSGRLDYGFGRGYQSVEFNGFGLSLEEARARTDEALDILVQAWTQDRVEHAGRFHRIDSVAIYPKPVQKPHPPLFVAAVSPETVEHYARRGVPFLAEGLATFGRLRRAAEVYRRVAAEHGFDPDAGAIGAMRSVCIAETAAEALERAAAMSALDPAFINQQSAPVDRQGRFVKGYEFWEKRYLSGNAAISLDFYRENIVIAGDPARIVEQIRQLERFGFKQILCNFGHEPEVVQRSMRLFAREVMPHFRAREALAGT